MKKIISVLLLILLSISLVGCTSETTAEKNLVVYYSLTGTTVKLAERLVEELDADVLVLDVVDQYPTDEDELNALVETQREEGLPALVEYDFDASAYDNIYVGGPVWNGFAANPLQTFLDTADFAGKNVYGFYTFGGFPGDYVTNFSGLVKNGTVKGMLGVSAADVDTAELTFVE